MLAVVIVVGARAAIGAPAIFVVLVVTAMSDADAVVTLEASRTLHGRDHSAIGPVVVVVHPAVAVITVLVVAVIVIVLAARPGDCSTVRDVGGRHPDLGQVVELESRACA